MDIKNQKETAARNALPRTHIDITRRTWRNVRRGLSRCLQNSEDRRRCLEWCGKFPDFTDAWVEILDGRHERMVDMALATEDYFDLPPPALAWWERVIQNHPFSAIFAREKYAALLQKREMKKKRA